MERLFKGMDKTYWPLVQALILSNVVSLLLFLVRVLGAENLRFGFLFWNLLLAVVPLPLAIWLTSSLKKHRWFSWRNLLITFLWLGFLPNSFYILTDLIHIHLTGEINILFDVVLFSSCIFNGFVFGYISLYLVHRQLLRRLSPNRAHLTVGIIIGMCSFAIYLGRYLRWNSWDVIAHPFGLLFDISGRLINPMAHPQTITTTLIFFLLLSSIYMVVWEFIRLLKRAR